MTMHETCEVCGDAAGTCTFSHACSCWRGIPCRKARPEPVISDRFSGRYASGRDAVRRVLTSDQQLQAQMEEQEWRDNI